MSYQSKYIVDGITAAIIYHQGVLPEKTEIKIKPYKLENMYWFTNPFIGLEPLLVEKGSIMIIRNELIKHPARKTLIKRIIDFLTSKPGF